jgi:hypothetical protein
MHSFTVLEALAMLRLDMANSKTAERLENKTREGLLFDMAFILTPH